MNADPIRPLSVLSLMLLATLLGGCGNGDDGNNTDGGTGPCATRQGGALITIDNPPGTGDGPDSITLWITNSAFIDEAMTHKSNNDWRVAMFDQVIASADCDSKHMWHVDPAKVSWADTAAEECDATVTYVSTNLTAWAARPTPSWCPWNARVSAVIDRR